jgi:hypothetical protein
MYGLIVIDFLIGNYNRTFADMGILVDSNTLKFIAPAPIFDYEESLDFNIYDDDIMGVFDDDIIAQVKMIKDFSWIDFEVIEDTVDEIDRIYSLGGFKNSDIKEIKAYFRGRVNALKKLIPPEQIKKKKPVETIPKTKKEEHKEEPIRIHIYEVEENIEENETENTASDE